MRASTSSGQQQQEEAPAQTPSDPPKERDPLLAAICHDLRAPLAAVTMGANFVLQTTPEAEASGRSRRVLQAILRSCKQMERIVRDFGDLSEIEGDALVLRMGLHDARQMLEMSVEAARTEGEARSIQLALVLPAQPILIQCDRDRILRALHHVLHNAVRFAPDGSTVTAALHEQDGDVSFAITDRGPGITQETLAHLYDRTWHAKRAERVGAGLGLAIVRGFVEAHGGHVGVETAEGGPTTFSLILPKSVPTKH
jgi:signal transduction histidine kinase